jgi:hypothetical protein
LKGSVSRVAGRLENHHDQLMRAASERMRAEASREVGVDCWVAAVAAAVAVAIIAVVVVVVVTAAFIILFIMHDTTTTGKVEEVVCV